MHMIPLNIYIYNIYINIYADIQPTGDAVLTGHATYYCLCYLAVSY